MPLSNTSDFFPKKILNQKAYSKNVAFLFFFFKFLKGHTRVRTCTCVNIHTHRQLKGKILSWLAAGPGDLNTETSNLYQ